ncbi:hypothetical protein BC936DRAFT_142986 [Jimgerdemannia flammicorona]|uniref:Uncharacterized protein n=1 Tax=Jimgerdemannia flammicorona TaxID=994334 RepID=A0A433DEH8_9FUNG|nr:hypothetical protein BC936DRAFT_142986 [Jimgerdemannia flammicorona]
MDSVPEFDIVTGPNTFWICDIAFRPINRPRPAPGQGCNSAGEAYPTMVVEVGVNQSHKSLYRAAAHYFSPRTTIQIYLAIKIFPRRQNGTRAMVALRFLRTNPNPTRPDIVKSFGTAPIPRQMKDYLQAKHVPDAAITGLRRPGDPACNAAGIALYQMNFPAALLFNGDPAGVPGALAAGFNLDLWIVQAAALRG